MGVFSRERWTETKAEPREVERPELGPWSVVYMGWAKKGCEQHLSWKGEKASGDSSNWTQRSRAFSFHPVESRRTEEARPKVHRPIRRNWSLSLGCGPFMSWNYERDQCVAEGSTESSDIWDEVKVGECNSTNINIVM